jgi:hypothetical protein
MNTGSCDFMTLCMLGFVLDDESTVFCPLCGSQVINVFALDEHFAIYQDGARDFFMQVHDDLTDV